MIIDIMNNSELEFNDKHKEIAINVIKKTISTENINEKYEISLTILNDEQIKEINLEYRGIDKETDTLSFPMIDFENEDIPENSAYLLGDIFVSMETAIRQANEYGHSIEREIGFLIAHSTLHLLGYDHMEENEEKEMFKKQEEILNSLELYR